MHRRRLLRGLAATGALGAVAGCTATDPDTTPGRDPDGTTTPGSEPDGPVAERDVGSREGVPFPENNGPHGLTVVNGAERARRVGVTVVGPRDTLLTDTWSVPAGARVRVRLLEPAAYVVRVAVEDERVATVEVPRRYFDCNQSGTTVTVDGAGRADVETVSTLVACPGPSVAGTGFERTDRRCAGEAAGTATVAVEDERVVVTGALETPTPCHDARLESVSYDTETDVLTAVVAEVDAPPTEPCIACLGAVEYELTVSLAGGYPGRMAVVHADGDGRETVTRTTLP